MPLFDPNPVDCLAVLQVLAERHRDEEVRGGTKDYAVALEYAVDLFKREPLVQEVIAAANAPVSPRWADRVSLAARRLAEWKP